jgi:hypothetical protein
LSYNNSIRTTDPTHNCWLEEGTQTHEPQTCNKKSKDVTDSKFMTNIIKKTVIQILLNAEEWSFDR